MKQHKKELLDRLNLLLSDDDLTDEKLRRASEGLLPNLADCLNQDKLDPMNFDKENEVQFLLERYNGLDIMQLEGLLEKLLIRAKRNTTIIFEPKLALP